VNGVEQADSEHAIQFRSGYKDVPITPPAGGTTPDGVSCTNEANDGNRVDRILDILGDWREEAVRPTSDNTALRIYSTPYETGTRITILLHDTPYRTAPAWQNTAYNRPPHPSFFIGDGTATARRPAVYSP